jgi:uncharacterized protein YabE (DUF348 family)
MRRFIKIIIAIIIISGLIRVFVFFNSVPRALSFENASRSVTMDDNGLVYSAASQADTVGDFLKEKNISLGEHDQIVPDKNSSLLPDMNIEIRRAVQVKILVDGKTISNWTLGRTVRQALAENNISLFRLDKTDPDADAPVGNDMTITVTRINVEDVTEDVDIPFQTVSKTDAKLGWRETNITTPGVKGMKEVKYQVTYKNGKVISKVALSSSIVKAPVTQAQTQGTYVQVGSAQTGQGTWYTYLGGMYAASLTIPRGGYARVTNTTTGKSVIVQINDSGPYGKGRIIDLDKVAFQKIADIGAGVINVKVEKVLN